VSAIDFAKIHKLELEISFLQEMTTQTDWQTGATTVHSPSISRRYTAGGW